MENRTKGKEFSKSTNQKGGYMSKREILLEKAYSNHPGDKHLSIVLAKWNGELVTWAHNKDDGGFFWGHYFDASEYKEAAADFLKRGVA